MIFTHKCLLSRSYNHITFYGTGLRQLSLIIFFTEDYFFNKVVIYINHDIIEKEVVFMSRHLI